MKNTFGNNISITLFGESHGAAIGAVIDGLPAGIKIDDEYIHSQLKKRKPAGKLGTARNETDDYSILSGVFEGKTCGTPLSILIKNENTKSSDYDKTRFLARPGHVDYTAYCKYKGFEDYRGGGHFSGRITAAIVAAGALLTPALKEKGIYIGSHIKSLGKECDRDFDNLKKDIEQLEGLDFAVLDNDKAQKMKDLILDAGQKKDSVGGVLETAVIGLPAGLGEPWFDSVESLISHAVFSIPAVKGIQFGAAFDMVNSTGSVFNDEFEMKDGKVVTKTNHNGGVNGGITNGMPILFRTAIKPTPSIYMKQETVNFMTKENAEIEIQGRHDPAIIHRARVVIDSMTALVIADLLTGRFGADYLGGKNEIRD